MRRGLIFLTGGALLWGVGAACAYAQKGMGEPAGVARQALKPEVVSLSGKVLSVETGPCKMTTGGAYVGTHFLLETPEAEKLNIHLGPTTAVGHIADRLVAGREVAVDAFRTEKMPEKHYVAEALSVDDTLIRLRDQGLRPFWARGGAVWRGRGGPESGPGYSGGPGWGRGRGYGRGSGWGGGPGYGWGRGPGYGWGPGAAAGRGAGLGRGWAFIDEDRDGICDYYQRRWDQK